MKKRKGKPTTAPGSTGLPLRPRLDLGRAFESSRAEAEADVHFQAGLAFQTQGCLQEALASYERSAALAPRAGTYNNLGNVQTSLGLLDEALCSFEKSIALDPSNDLAYYNFGRIHHNAGRYEAALDAYSRCIALDPKFPEVYSNCGLVLLECKQYEPALDCLLKAIEIRPDFSEAYNNAGDALLELRQYADAVRCFEKAIELRPDFAKAFNNLGLALTELDKFDAAALAYRHAASLDPRYGHAAGQAYMCSLRACDWSRKEADEIVLRRMVSEGVTGIPVFSLLNIADAGDLPLADFLRKAAYQLVVGKYQHLSQPPMVAPSTAKADAPLRIGYLSADFLEHATMHLLRGVLAAHDRQAFKLFGYSWGGRDNTTDEVAQCFDVFRDIDSLSDHDAARLIAEDEIDILIDLKGHTGRSRLQITALRPAPVIVNWLGYPGTLGHPRLADYIIGDPVVTPREDAPYFSETLVLMPHCYQPNDDKRPVATKPSRAELGLPENGFVFCYLGQIYKLTPEILDIWGELLREIPDSVLWLLIPPPAAMPNLQHELARRGISERVVFSAALAQSEHLGRLQAADLALDTFPVTSHTTASDALWAGVPLVTVYGTTFASRVAASLLHTLGLPELVADSYDAYCRIAMELAQDRSRLKGIRERLASARRISPLFDTARFTRNFEAALRQVWDQHRRGIKQTIEVSASS